MKFIGRIWKKLPPVWRQRFVRATQQTFTVSVGALVVDGERKVLLLDHHLRPASGWGLPGGFIEQGEQPHEAIRRELREETGLEIEDVRLLAARTVRRHVEILFCARPAPHSSARVACREIKAFGWFAGDELPAGLSAVQKTLIARVLRGEFDNFFLAD